MQSQTLAFISCCPPPHAPTPPWQYYWMAMSEGDPQGDPVVLWLNGGPVRGGAGGMFGGCPAF